MRVVRKLLFGDTWRSEQNCPFTDFEWNKKSICYEKMYLFKKKKFVVNYLLYLLKHLTNVYCFYTHIHVTSKVFNIGIL